MQELFLELHAREKFTALVVTHDLAEAVRLGDNILGFYGRPLQYKVFNSQIKSEEVKQELLEGLKSIFSYREVDKYAKRVLHNQNSIRVWSGS